MTKKHSPYIFILSIALSAFHPLYAQKASSSQVKQASFKVGNIIALKQAISNNPSLSWFIPFLDNIGQLKKSMYTITGIENFPLKHRKQLVRQFRNGVGIILELLDNPEKEKAACYQSLEKLQKTWRILYLPQKTNLTWTLAASSLRSNSLS